MHLSVGRAAPPVWAGPGGGETVPGRFKPPARHRFLSMPRAQGRPTRVRRRRAIPLAPASVLADVAPDPQFEAWAERVLRQPALRSTKRTAESPPSEMAIPIPERIARELRISKGFEIVLEFPPPKSTTGRSGPTTSAFDDPDADGDR